MTANADQATLSLLEKKAQTQACHWGFIKIYEAQYFTSPNNSQNCIELSYQRAISRQQLIEATYKIYQDTFGEEQTKRDWNGLEKLSNAYQAIKEGDSYRYCTSKISGGTLQYNNTNIMTLNNADIANRIMGIWVKNVNQEGYPQWNFPTC